MVFQHSEGIFFTDEQQHLWLISQDQISHPLGSHKVAIYTSCRYLSTKVVHPGVFWSSHFIMIYFTTTQKFSFSCLVSYSFYFYTDPSDVLNLSKQWPALWEDTSIVLHVDLSSLRENVERYPHSIEMNDISTGPEHQFLLSFALKCQVITYWIFSYFKNAWFFFCVCICLCTYA